MSYPKKIINFILVTTFFFSVNAKEMKLDNMIDPDKNWEFVSDQVMGGVSFGKKIFLKEEDAYYLRMTGFVSLENNGGFIQTRLKIKKNNNDIKGLLIKARGNQQEYKIHIRTKLTMLPWQYYTIPFKANEDWEYTKLSFNLFKRSGILLPKNINSKHITSIAVVAFGKEYKVRLDVSEIRFY